jgi:hypothetical protein
MNPIFYFLYNISYILLTKLKVKVCPEVRNDPIIRYGGSIINLLHHCLTTGAQQKTSDKVIGFIYQK